ncbi:MAG: methyltransferase domain-containing protein [Mobilicoccus sp.]|nr:methyltransferase domain-containing protein [Mobilicoccus sp.]
MQCDYFDAGRCRSCPHMGVPYSDQLAAKDARVRALLDRPGLHWESPFASPEAGFRAKAKMVTAGTPTAPTLGILDRDGHGIDLRGCGLLGPAAHAAMPALARFVTEVGLRPYDVPSRTGELKGIQVVEASSGDLMVRFVLRSTGQVGKLRRGLPSLMHELPTVRVVSVNLLPQHVALPEGEEEIVLTEQDSLPMPVGDVVLYPQPGAFVQTNTHVAAGLYRQAGAWVDEAAPASVLDLYCGIGGFALHAAAPGRDVTGVEVSEQAVASARRSAAEADLTVRFEVGDATAHLLEDRPDLVIVNPPRRGIGPELATRLEASDVATVVYSSCNPATLAADLDAMPSLRPVRARLFDMFPQTDHAEVLTLLRRA